ncbi:MAG: O-methyltransferase, partial [Candidatus Binatia bacterium]
VKAFLERHRGTWQDLNVPEIDGRTLHDLILENKYTRALEIGTSTGHSGIWIAWALSKTGGKLTTVEIDPARYEQAKANVAAAGLSQVVEFILGDAHKIVPAAQGRYDFIFSDADKDWYTRYFDALYPKLIDTACFVAHNVEESRFGFTRGWVRDYLKHVRSVADMETSIHPDGRAGVAITCKKTA